MGIKAAKIQALRNSCKRRIRARLNYFRTLADREIHASALVGAEAAVFSAGRETEQCLKFLPLTLAALAAYSGAPFYLRAAGLFERVFHLQENQTTVRRELLAGLNPLLTTAHVGFVNPPILSEGGMPVGGVLFSPLPSPARAPPSLWLWGDFPLAPA